MLPGLAGQRVASCACLTISRCQLVNVSETAFGIHGKDGSLPHLFLVPDGRSMFGS